MRRTLPQALLIVLAAGVATATHAQTAPQEQGQLEGVYSLVGALDGDATLFAARSGAQSDLEIHLPVLRGDRIWTNPYGRLAVLMSDRSILALDHDSEVTLAQIAGSPDADDMDSLYVLHRGRLSLEVPNNLLDWELPAIDTTNARVYAKQGGRYQVESDGDRWAEIAVLDGFAEVVTQRGSVIVRDGEALLVQGLDDPWIELQSGAGAAALALDEWVGAHRTRLAAYAAVDVDGYGSSLTDHGQWVEVEDGRAWKPAVEDDWQPYSRGRWTHTPAGLYWVARDPWGPLTYHYGSWNLYPGYGWLWFPSSIYAPSHVYWYWGPSYVGWIPRGYYHRYYLGRGFGLRWGLYGWAGGFWDPFNTWIFCPSGYLGYGRGYTYGRSLRQRHPKLARGIITTDTNGIDYRNWRNPEAVQQVLLGKRRGLSESELPDVTDFVARRTDLNETLKAKLTRTPDQQGTVRVVGGPPVAGRSGLVGVTAGGVRTRSNSPTAGAGTESGTGVTLRRRSLDDARRTEAPKAVRVSSGGLTAAPTSTTTARDSEGADDKAPARVAAPRASGNVLDRTRRPTPARRVLDAIRGRDAVPAAPRTANPPSRRPERVNAPRTATPSRTRSVPTRTSAPKSTPTRTRSTPPRASTPRSTPTRTRSTPPRASTPKSTPTRTRSTPPRASTPRSTPTRTRSTPPRASTPKSTPTRTRSTPPRASTPRSTPTRTRSTPPTRTRSTPRASSPRSSPPSRSYTPPSRPSSYSPPPRSSSPSAPPPSDRGRTPP